MREMNGIISVMFETMTEVEIGRGNETVNMIKTVNGSVVDVAEVERDAKNTRKSTDHVLVHLTGEISWLLN